MIGEKWLQVITIGYKRLQLATRGYNWLQEATSLKEYCFIHALCYMYQYVHFIILIQNHAFLKNIVLYYLS